MRKKLLSLLTALCLVLGMLPATALAAEAAADAAAEYGYSEGDIAQYVSEDTTITEDVDGLVLVVAPVSVTVSGAKLSTGLMVAPGAEGAKVELTGAADVNAVIVMAAAEVSVAEDAVAATVTVTAADTTVTVAGEVKAVNVAETAENAVVTVTETAKVETVEVAAPAAAVEVAGTVKTVTVAETAAAASVTVAETAAVTALEVAAPDVKAEVAGTVESVTVAETATGAELVVAETATITEVTDATGELTVSGDGAENVTVTDASDAGEEPAEEDKKDEDAEAKEPEDEGIVFDPIITTPTKTAPAGAPKGNLAMSKELKKENGSIQITDVTTTYSGAADAVYNVKVTAANIKVTTSGSKEDGNTGATSTQAKWFGVGIPVADKGNEDGYVYKYYMLTRYNGIPVETMHEKVFTGDVPTTSQGQSYRSTSTSLDEKQPDWTTDGQAYHGSYVMVGTDYVNKGVLWTVGVEVYQFDNTVNLENGIPADAQPIWTEIYDFEIVKYTENENVNTAAVVLSDEENGTPIGGDDDSKDDNDAPDDKGGNNEGGEDETPGDVEKVVEPVEITKTSEGATDTTPAADAE